MSHLPDEVAQTLLAYRGPGAREWVERLPAILDDFAQRWSLTLGEPLTPLSFNYVARATRSDGTPVVLKVGLTDDPEFAMEGEALRHCGGSGMVKLLDMARDDAEVALLLERIEPGLPLTTMEDDTQAVAIAAGVMRRFWRPVPEPHGFPTIARWAQGLERHRERFGGSGPISARLFARAVSLYAELGATMGAPVLLHGDLHQENILAATREPWLAIDPKGLVGEPAYETGSMLRNTRAQFLALPDPKPLLSRRIAQFADELELDRERIRGWGEAQAVLSACWTLEDGEDPRRAAFAIGCAEALADIKV